MHYGLPYEFIPMFWSLFLFLGCWGMVLVGRNIKAKTRLKESELIYRERIEAMQKGLTLPSAPELHGLESAGAAAGPSTAPVDWFRMVSLALGLFFFFTGLGMCGAFLAVEDFREIWSLGFIPAMAGIGFLLFYSLSRSFKSTPNQA